MKKPIPAETRNAIIEARKAGMRGSEIAEKFNVAASTVSRVLIDAGLRTSTRGPRKHDGRTCPKCHRGPFPEEYTFCPFCTTDMRSEREHVIETLQRAKARLRVPLDDASSAINYAIVKAITYLENNK
jgi:hypothetical protein